MAMAVNDPRKKAVDRAAVAKTDIVTAASLTDTFLAATGRRHLRGCQRSLSTSFMSLRQYMALAAKLNMKNAYTAGSHRSLSVSLPLKKSGR